MSDIDRRSAKLSKQPEIDDEDHGICTGSTVVTVINKPIGGISTPTVLSASSSETSPDEQPVKPPITRKQTLIRTPALEGTSPPPDSFFSPLRTNGSPGSHEGSPVLPNGATTTLCFLQGSENSQSAKEFLLSSHEAVSNDSGRGTLDITDAASEKSLSRTSSTETNNTSLSQQMGICSQESLYKDSSGIDLIEFFKLTLQKSPKDKKTLLFLEKELHNFVRDDTISTKKLHDMNPYDRMLVHRLAAHMGIEHNVDQSGKSVVVGKTDITRIPEYSLTDYLREMDTDSQVKKKILLKKPASLDEKQSRGLGKLQLGDTRTKSLEERQQVYFRTRERIFAESQNLDGSQNPTLLTASGMPHMIQHQGSLDTLRPSLGAARNSHNFKSADSAADYQASLGLQYRRSHMTKSNSYAGSVSPHTLQHMTGSFCPAMLSAPSAVPQTVQAENLRFESPPPMMGTPSTVDPAVASQAASESKESVPHDPQSACPTSYAYLVSSDYSSIPVGSLIINPLTMQPHVNADGSMYRFDPNNPPPFMAVPPAPAPPVNAATPPTPSMVYAPGHQETGLTPMTGQFGRLSITGMEGVAEACTMGHSVPIMSHVMPQVYASQAQPTFQQGQYFTTSPAPGQPSVRLIAINQPTAAPVEAQGQTTVPMPAVQAYTPVQLVGGPGHPYHQLTMAGTQEELMASAAYAQLAASGPETLTVNSGGQFVQGYSLAQAFPGQPAGGAQYQTVHPAHHHQTLPAPGPAYAAAPVANTTTYYAMPPSTPTPPPMLNHPPPPPPPTSGPPSQHHHHHQHHTSTTHHNPHQQQHHHAQQQQQPQQHQAHVVAVHPSHHPQQHQQPSSAPQMYSVVHNPSAGSALTFPHPSSSSPSLKSWAAGPAGVFHPHYRPPSPPQQPQQLTINYLAPPPGPPGPATQLVALPAGSYQQRPLGTVIQLGTAQSFQGQPCLYRPFTPLQGAPSLRPRLPLQLTAQTHGQQTHPRPKLNGTVGKPKKGGKKPASTSEEESQGQTMNLVTPLIPGLNGASTHTFIPPATSNRQ